MVVSIDGTRQWLWRAVDSEGEVLDHLVACRTPRQFRAEAAQAWQNATAAT
jgi:transposase-like protein